MSVCCLMSSQLVCAGVWHNVVLCGMCWAVAVTVPWLLLPMYRTGQGAVVRSVHCLLNYNAASKVVLLEDIELR